MVKVDNVRYQLISWGRLRVVLVARGEAGRADRRGKGKKKTEDGEIGIDSKIDNSKGEWIQS